MTLFGKDDEMQNQVERVERVESSISTTHELSVEQVIGRIKKVHAVMQRAMVKDHHYGVIPGTQKPTLLKPGMELLCLMFRLDPQYQITEQRAEDGHLTVTSTCTLYHIPTGQRWGSGMGSCSTRESKYAYRMARKTCPKCRQATIIPGKKEYGGGWICFKKIGGCGAKFDAEDKTVSVASDDGRVANEDLADTENTVLKMSNKRALGSAVLNVTAASDIFTVDLEDFSPPLPPGEEPEEKALLTAPKRISETKTEEEPTPPAPSSKTITDKQAARFWGIARTEGRKSELEVQKTLGDAGYTGALEIPAADYEEWVKWAQKQK